MIRYNFEVQTALTVYWMVGPLLARERFACTKQEQQRRAQSCICHPPDMLEKTSQNLHDRWLVCLDAVLSSSVYTVCNAFLKFWP